MMYQIFREKGMLIGSSSIESAHRKVIQKRITCSETSEKQSGQQVAKLRSVHINHQWNKVVQLIKHPARAT